LEVEMNTKTTAKEIAKGKVQGKDNPATEIKKEEEVKQTESSESNQTESSSTDSKESTNTETITSTESQTEKTSNTIPNKTPNKPLNLATLNREIEALRQTIQDHTNQIADLKELISLKRKPTANGKIQIKDKQTGKVYPSKNNCYQSLLKAGELKELISKGIFGDNPEKNNFGWFALNRALPDRFEELKEEMKEESKEEPNNSDK